MLKLPFIPLLFLTPIFGAMAIAILPGSDRIVRWVALAWSLIVLGATGWLAWCFEWDKPSEWQFPTLQGNEDMWYRQLGVQLSFGADAMSMWLLLLTGVLGVLGILASWDSVKIRVKEFHAWYLLLIAALIATFTAQDAILFYVAFEFTLIPMFFLISVYGGHERREAAKTFFLYTFAGSMIALTAILYMGYFYSTLPATKIGGTEPGVWNFRFDALWSIADNLNGPTQGILLLALMLGFAVKIPLFPFHSVPPAAYPQAPTAGSVFLAAVLAKMGIYGMVRLVLPLLPLAVLEYGWIIGVLAVAGILYCAMICWSQRSIKKLIAYSSISHLGFCVMGLMSLNLMAMSGAGFYMINHGITIAGLFFCVGMLQERFKTDDMPMLGGLAKVMPVWSFFFVFFALANVGLPGLNGFWGEFTTLMGTFQSGMFGALRIPGVKEATQENWSHMGMWLATFAALGVIISAIYMLHMLGKVVFGPVRLPVLGAGADTAEPTHGVAPAEGNRLAMDQVKDLGLRELVVVLPLALGCLWFGVQPSMMMNSMAGVMSEVQQPANLRSGPQSRIRAGEVADAPAAAEPAVKPAKAKKDAPAKTKAEKDAAKTKAQKEKAEAQGPATKPGPGAGEEEKTVQDPPPQPASEAPGAQQTTQPSLEKAL